MKTILKLVLLVSILSCSRDEPLVNVGNSIISLPELVSILEISDGRADNNGYPIHNEYK